MRGDPVADTRPETQQLLQVGYSHNCGQFFVGVIADGEAHASLHPVARDAITEAVDTARKRRMALHVDRDLICLLSEMLK